MSESWLELVEPCEHGKMSPHHPDSEVVWGMTNPETGKMGWGVDYGARCPGGRRRRVTINYEAAKRKFDEVYYSGGHAIEEVLKATVDAALDPY